MTFEVEVNGRSRSVAVERVGAGRYRVTIEGRTHHVAAARTGEYGVMLLDTAAETVAIPREVFLTPGAGTGQLLATTDGRTASVVVNGRRSRRAGDTTVNAAGEQRIVAPMPGRVVRVLVSTGDEVEARQPLVVVEAMKMENELRAAGRGRVRDVSVVPGTSVEAGRVLVVIE
jgi:biotin carboxyl carrier protein